mmetsp:Transcript_19765/g.49726  ORF Transcript_19765/g.49726 Transcript_19765/m.49726 type:complete len:304 (-) Transcript_19765:650-1561(-)
MAVCSRGGTLVSDALFSSGGVLHSNLSASSRQPSLSSTMPSDRPVPSESAEPPKMKTRQEGMASTSCMQWFHRGTLQFRSMSVQSLFSTSSMKKSLNCPSLFHPPKMNKHPSFANAECPLRGAGGLPWHTSCVHRLLSRFKIQVSLNALRVYPDPPCPPKRPTEDSCSSESVWLARCVGTFEGWSERSTPPKPWETTFTRSEWKPEGAPASAEAFAAVAPPPAPAFILDLSVSLQDLVCLPRAILLPPALAAGAATFDCRVAAAAPPAMSRKPSLPLLPIISLEAEPRRPKIAACVAAGIGRS